MDKQREMRHAEEKNKRKTIVTPDAVLPTRNFREAALRVKGGGFLVLSHVSSSRKGPPLVHQQARYPDLERIHLTAETGGSSRSAGRDFMLQQRS